MPHLINLSHQDVDSEYNLEGYETYDSAGERLGKVHSVIVDGDSMEPRYLVVDAGGWFSSRQFVVPAGDIRQIDDNERHVYFNTLTKRTLKSGAYPQYDEHWWDTNDHRAFGAHEREIARAYQPGRARDAEVNYSGDLYRRPAEGARRLQLMEERLLVNKERYQAGNVTLGKRITERPETVNVPVRAERVVIERIPVSSENAVTNARIDDGETIEVPVMEERVLVDKKAVVAEEVGVRTEAVERTEQVRDTVRKEELVVEGDRDLVREGGRAATEHQRGQGPQRGSSSSGMTPGNSRS